MGRNRRKDQDFFICPCCGAEVAVGAPVCRECGASDEFGWDEGYWGDDELPAGYSSDDDFDYDEFVGEEFPAHAPLKRRFRRWVVVFVVLLTCAAFLAWTFIQR